ncbi:MAG: FAD-dependent oxidoreductase [Xanthomonadales bacterium]|nr:FAD-dependent oxidoreductase [Xanthomonadales bacterium]
MQSQAKIVIIGGGIMGVGLLYHLAEARETDVLLIEKGELTSGSTWHAAGQCPSLVGDFNMAKIHHHGNTLYPRLEELTGQYTSWHSSGGIRLGRNKEDLDWFKYMQGIADNVGFRMQIIGVDEIRQINPFLDTKGVIAGAWTLDDGHADPAGLTFAMAKGATRRGASIERFNRVTGLRQMENGEWEVSTEKGIVTAEMVVNAAGSFARRVAQMVGLDLPICNMEHQYVVTGPVPEFEALDTEMPVIRDPYAHCYMRQEQKSGLIGVYERVGMTLAWGPAGLPSWESDSELFPDDLERIIPWLGKALERLPVLENAGIKRIVNGAIPHSADGPPLLGPVAGLQNYWLACGASFGIAQGAGCGKYLAQWMLEGDSEINMTSLDPRRFGLYADESYMLAKGFQDYGLTYTTALPSEEHQAARKCRLSPLYENLKALGAVYTQTNGWERPKWFSVDGREEDYSFRHNNIHEVVGQECLAVRDRVGVQDMSAFAKYEVCGPDAESFLNRIFANRMPVKHGGIVLAHLLSEAGRIQCEMTITRLDNDHFYLLSAAFVESRDIDILQKSRLPDERVEISNVTEQRGVLVVAGPESRSVLSKLTDSDLDSDSFRWLSAQNINLAGKMVRALRVNYVGELGWELHPMVNDMESIYDAVWQAGQEFGIANYGLNAMNSLRMEKAYHGFGSELTNEISMPEAGIDRFFRTEKDSFVGKQATLKQMECGLQWKTVYFETDSTDSDVRGGEPVFFESECIGVTTSGGFGHRVQKGLGFAFVKIEYAAAGQRFDIGLLGDRIEALVLAEAVYDPGNHRIRS